MEDNKGGRRRAPRKGGSVFAVALVAVLAIAYCRPLAAAAASSALPTIPSITSALFASSTSTGDSVSDRANLLKFKKSISNWEAYAEANGIQGWSSSVAVCNWGNIKCVTGRVAVLDMSCPGGCKIAAIGSLSPELAGLNNLVELSLAGHMFTGTLPTSWGNSTAFQKLVAMNLTNNSLTGVLPETWSAAGCFPALTDLHLDGNLINGTLPVPWGGASAFPSLINLTLGYNVLTGSIPGDWGTENGFNRLEHLDISGNRLVGPLPVLWASGTAFQRLHTLRLGTNMLSGSVPGEWGSLGAFPLLAELNLRTNTLAGNLPLAWGVRGALPNLASLLLQENNLTGTLPYGWGAVSEGNFPHLLELDLSSNQLTGSLPNLWVHEAFPQLKSLSLSSNRFNGSLRGVAFWGTGGTPFPSLSLLYLGGNQLSGSLPTEWGSNDGFKYLSELDLSANRLNGILPREWGIVPASNQPLFPELRSINLRGNRLSGSLPPEYGEGGQGLGTGVFPFPQLEFMSLQSNRLTGGLPYIWGQNGAFPSLRELVLAGNSVGPYVPYSWSTLPALSQVWLTPMASSFCGEIPERPLICGLDPSCSPSLNSPCSCNRVPAFNSTVCASGVPNITVTRTITTAVQGSNDTLVVATFQITADDAGKSSSLATQSLSAGSTADSSSSCAFCNLDYVSGQFVKSLQTALQPIGLLYITALTIGRPGNISFPSVAAAPTAQPKPRRLLQQVTAASTAIITVSIDAGTPEKAAGVYNDLATSYMWSTISKNLAPNNPLLASNGVVLTAISLYPPKWALQLTPVPAPAPIYIPAPGPAPAVSVAAAGPQVVGPSVDVYLQAARGPMPPPLPVSRRAIITIFAVTIPVVVVLSACVSMLVYWLKSRRLSRMERIQSSSRGLSNSLAGTSERMQSNESDGHGLAMNNPLLKRGGTNNPLMDVLNSAQDMPMVSLPFSDWEIRADEIVICKRPDGKDWCLGEGSAGTVYRATKAGVQMVAAKVFRMPARQKDRSYELWRNPMSDEEAGPTGEDQDEPHSASALTSLLKAFMKEVSILKSCHDRNVVQFLGACLHNNNLMMITEFMEGGDLMAALSRDKGRKFTWRSRFVDPATGEYSNKGLSRKIALDIAKGLHFLHDRQIVHFDIKSSNILLGRDWTTAKIADVGLSKILRDGRLSTLESVGTFNWTAPEVLTGKYCDEKVDIFSYGVVLWELSTGEVPGCRQLRDVKVPEECPQSIADLISRCRSEHPEERPSAMEIIEYLRNI